MTPQSTKNRRFGSQNHPKIDPGTEKSILRDFVKILLFLRRQHDSQGPALPEIDKNRPRSPSGGGQRVQQRSGATFSSIFRFLLILIDLGVPWGAQKSPIFLKNVRHHLSKATFLTKLAPLGPETCKVHKFYIILPHFVPNFG